MANILFLAHRIPYPPNKGDKIRSWNFLAQLMEHHCVHLGFFVDNPDDQQHIAFLEAKAASLCWQNVSPLHQKILSVRGFVSGQSLTQSAYPYAQLQQYARSLLDSGTVDLVFLFSAATAPILPEVLSVPLLCDFVDVDSEKWRTYAQKAAWPMSWVYRREANKLAQFEHNVACRSQQSLFVSADEASLFASLNPTLPVSPKAVPNGVDLTSFDPSLYPAMLPLEKGGRKQVIFTGAMDYQPNIEAVVWFCTEVWPLVRKRHEDAVFTIAGGPVPARVARLNDRRGVTVLGYVDDMAQVIATASLSVAPMLTARGIQNKILEAMAMAKPVVATSLGNEGINAVDGQHLYVADNAALFADTVCRLLETPDKAAQVGKAGRQFVTDRFSWEQAFASLNHLITSELA